MLKNQKKMQSRFNSYYFAEKLIIFLPWFLLTGPALGNLSSSLVALIFLYIVSSDKNYYYFNNRIFILFMLFYLYILLNALINFIDIKALKNSLFYFRFGLFFLSIWYFFNKIKDLYYKFYLSFLILFLVLIFDTIFQLYFGKNIFGYKLFGHETGVRVSSFFNDELILGSFVSRFYLIFVGLYFFLNIDKKKYLNHLSLLVMCILPLIVFISGERTSFFMVSLMLFVQLILYKKNRIFIISFITLVICLTIFLKPAVTHRMMYQTLDQLGFYNQALKVFNVYKERKPENLKLGKKHEDKEKKYIFSVGHQSIYNTAFAAGVSSPVFGIGPNNFRYVCNDLKYKNKNYACSTHPHNYYLQIFTELGLIGFLFMVFIYIFSFIKCILFKFRSSSLNISKEYSFLIACIATLLITFFPLMPTGNLFNGWLNIINFTPLGFIMSEYDRLIRKKK